MDLKRNTEKRDDKKTLEVLYEISQAVSRTRNLDELYRVIHKALDKILTVENFFIALHHEDRDSITFPYHVNQKDSVPDEIFNFSETASLTGQVIDSRRPLIFYEQDVIDFATARKQPTIGNIPKVWLGAPLVVRKRVIGAVSIQSFDALDDYVEKDLDLLNTMSQHIALALERKEFENQLQEQQTLLQTILESSPAGICLVEGRVFQWVNTQMVKMLGYRSKDDLTGKSVAIIYPDRKGYEEAGQIIETGMREKGRADFDMELKRIDNSRFKAHLSITGSGEDRGRGRTIAIVADISQLETAHQERVEKEKLQGVLEMAGAVCHEINQPLQAIMGYTELFETSDTISPGSLRQMKAQAARIGEITRRLAKITRYETMSYPGDATIVDIWRSSN